MSSTNLSDSAKECMKYLPHFKKLLSDNNMIEKINKIMKKHPDLAYYDVIDIILDFEDLNTECIADALAQGELKGETILSNYCQKFSAKMEEIGDYYSEKEEAEAKEYYEDKDENKENMSNNSDVAEVESTEVESVEVPETEAVEAVAAPEKDAVEAVAAPEKDAVEAVNTPVLTNQNSEGEKLGSQNVDSEINDDENLNIQNDEESDNLDSSDFSDFQDLDSDNSTVSSPEINASNYIVKITSIQSGKHIFLERAIVSLTDYNNIEAKILLKNLPAVVDVGLSEKSANDIAFNLRSSGATVEIEQY